MLDKYDLTERSCLDLISAKVIRESKSLSDWGLGVAECFTAVDPVQSNISRRMTSERVQVAFWEKPVLAHQLVGLCTNYPKERVPSRLFRCGCVADELPDRILL